MDGMLGSEILKLENFSYEIFLFSDIFVNYWL